MIQNNYCIIMAGGVGSRFWPFSTNSKPKQFLDFFGTGRSLLQMTFDRFLPLVPAENIYIVTNQKYKDMIMQQLPALSEQQILLEPMRRNTAPCIAYAAYKIREKAPKANIVVAPSDHLITNTKEFERIISKGLDFVKQNDNLLTLGMLPSRPETGYGYIQITPGESDLRPVKTFTEKPNAEMAQLFLDSGDFYWNSGMFLWRCDVIIKAFEELLPEVAVLFEKCKDSYFSENEQTIINESYSLSPNISIDYGIMEKAENVNVQIADFGWSDLGTWSSLHELSTKDEDQNATLKCQAQFYNSKNNIVALPEGKLAVIDGLDNYLIAEDHGVLLICKKDEESKIRDYVDNAASIDDGKFV